MEVSSQPHALATLPPGKDPSIHWIGGWVGSRVCLDVVVKTEKNPFPCPCQELNPEHPACSLVTVLAEKLWLL